MSKIELKTTDGGEVLYGGPREGGRKYAEKLFAEAKSKKQIEEMAKIFCGMKNGCDGCMFNKVHCNERNYAEEIYNAGYRKQSEGEWITKHRHRGGFRTVTVVDSFGEKHTGMVDERWECDDLYCSVCGKISHDAFLNYCANCGAKMKGGGE